MKQDNIKVRLCINGIPWKDSMENYDVINNDIKMTMGFEVKDTPLVIQPLFSHMEMVFEYKDIIKEQNRNGDDEPIAIYDLKHFSYPELEHLRRIEQKYVKMIRVMNDLMMDNTILMSQREGQDEQLAVILHDSLKYKKWYKGYKKKYNEIKDAYVKLRNGKKKVKHGKKKS